MMLDFLNKIFGKVEGQTSKNIAKERLRLVLVHDRTNMSPEMLEALKVDLIAVISKYMDIDEPSMRVDLDSSDNSIALVASIPVKQVKGPNKTWGNVAGSVK